MGIWQEREIADFLKRFQSLHPLQLQHCSAPELLCEKLWNFTRLSIDMKVSKS